MASCASSGALLHLRAPDTNRGAGNGRHALPELGIAKTSASVEPAAAATKSRYASLDERQLHMIADSQLDVTREDVEGLLSEIQAQRMLAQAALEDAAAELRRRRAADFEDPALRRLRELASVSQDARGTVALSPS
jgi:hypothetical protein